MYEPSSRAGVLAGLALLAVLAVSDRLLGMEAVLLELMAAAPVVAAVLGAGARDAAAVGVAALGLAFALGLADGALGTNERLAAFAAITTATVLAVVVARARTSLRAGRSRAMFLAQVGELFDAALDPDETIERVAGLAVPGMADLCIIDMPAPDGRTLRGVGVAASDPALAVAVRDLRERAPLSTDTPHPVVDALRTGDALLIRELREHDVHAWAATPEHARFMLAHRYGTALVVPLIARGRTLGVVSALRLHGARPYADEDLGLMREVAARAALALDNASLFAELRRGERQLEAVLGNLADAVTVQAPDGKVVYANAAAARLAGRADPRELVGDDTWLLSQWDMRDESGATVPAERLPGRLALTGATPEPVLLHLAARGADRERWLMTRATPVHDEDGRVALAVNVIEDVTGVKRDERAQRFLAQASKLLGSSLDPEVTWHKVAWAVVPELADFCAVDVPVPGGGRRTVARAAVESWPAGDIPARDEATRLLRDGGAAVVPAADPSGSGGARVAPGAPHAGDALVVPVSAAGELLGVLTLATAPGGRTLAARELPLARELADRAGIAVANARLHAERSHVAATLQRSLRPPRLPVVPGLGTAARFRAAGEASEVGGDFYDLFAVGDAWYVVIGDVTGKGPEAAATTALARYTLRTAAAYEASPGAILARLNTALVADGAHGRLATAACLRVVPGEGDGRVTVACGGHPLPLVLGDGVREIGAPGTILGAFEQGEWEDTDVRLAPGEALVLYTDGVTDATGARERFGFERLHAALATLAGTGADADAVAAHVDGALRAFEDGPQGDDVALLVLRRDAGGGGQASQRSSVQPISQNASS